MTKKRLILFIAMFVFALNNLAQMNLSTYYLGNSKSNVTYNEWHYVAITKSSTLQGQVYLDGVLIRDTLWQNNSYYYSKLYVGAGFYTSFTGFFKGQIDELRVSNKIRTQSEIQSHYNSNQAFGLDNNTYALFHFDEKTGTVINNEKGGSGTIKGGTYTTGKFGSSLNLDGISNYADCNISVPTSNITIEFWFKADGYQSDVTLIQPYGMYNSNITLVKAVPPPPICPQPTANLTQPTCFVKTGQIDVSSPKGKEYSYSIDGKTFQTGSDTIFRLVNPGTYNLTIKHTTGCTNSKSFTINPVPTSLTATATPAGPLKICEGSSIKLSANTGKNYTYQWVKDKVAIQGANTQEYIATKAGKYTVFINDGACKDTSDVITIDTIPLPAAPVINNSYLNVCNTMLREEVARQNQIDLNYRWYRSETGNDSLQKYEPLMPGYKQYYLSQFSATNPACESKKRTRVDVDMSMPVQINYPTTTTLCQGDSLKLEAFLNGNQWDYVWMKDYNIIPNTQGKTSIIVKETGNYSVTTMNCMYQGNQIINITFNPAPDAKISFTGSTILPVGGSLTLTVTDKQGNKYEWYKNGTLIQGASTNSYLAKEIGKYSVKVTNGTCSASSIPVELTGNNCNTDKPVVSSSQSFCGQAKVSDLKASGTDIKWYATTTGGLPLSITTALNNGSVYYASQTLNNCESTTRSAVNVIINSLPNATISPSGNLASICEGSSLIIKATGGTSYKWNSGETTSEIVVNTGGAHYADVINEFGCKKVVWLDVRVNPIPKVSIINLKSIIFKNEQNIPLNATPKGGVFSGEGVENDVLNLTKISLGSKFITYKYTDANGCTGLANANVIVVDSIGNVCKVTNYDTVKVIKYDTIKVKESTYDTLKIKVQLTTGIKTGQLTSMNIYPNPTSDILIIEASDIQALSGYKYKIVDLQGKEVYNALATSAKTEISLKSIGAKGMYILHIVDEKEISIENKKIVLE